MRILGICHDVLICSAGLIEDGRVVVAIPEERLDRNKQSRVFPTRAIQACLDQAGVTMADIDEIAVAWNPGIDAETTPSGWVDARRWRAEHFSQVPIRFLQSQAQRAADTISVQSLWPDAPPITYVDHYLSHFGNAYYLSPYDACAVAIFDGRAERKTGMLARARGTELEILQETNYPHSLGLLYGAVTQFLGFRPDSDEWKVMALASYAEADNEYLEPMRRLVDVHDDGGFSVDLSYLAYYNYWDGRMYGDRFAETFGPPRTGTEPLTSRHERIAAAMQEVFEEALIRILGRLHENSGEDRLVVSGGCFMNSVLNGKITDLTPFKEVFITSCPDDSGTSIGAALYLHGLRTGEHCSTAMTHNYWGPSYSDEECRAVVDRFKLVGEEATDPGKSAAEDLAAGKLVGWFQGPAEFGQRALGGRSILADPRRGDAKELVNAAVKYREGFRPFAPAILAEKVAEWFECEPDTRVPFMERVHQFRSEKRDAVPAVVHVDGSGRLQTVDAHANPRYHRLISQFEELTGVPIVLNTSFNLNGEPIVCAPEDAVRTFYSCGLDVLYLGNVRVTK
jgi:carbamoyltransferase